MYWAILAAFWALGLILWLLKSGAVRSIEAVMVLTLIIVK